MFHWSDVFTYGIIGHQHRLTDERSADLKVFQPFVDIIISVQWTGWELSWLMTRKHRDQVKTWLISVTMHCLFVFYHNVDFSFSFLNDEGATQSKAFFRVVRMKSIPQSCYKTVDPRPLLGPHLQDLLMLQATAALTLLIFILSFVWSTHVTWLKFTQTHFSIINHRP